MTGSTPCASPPIATAAAALRHRPPCATRAPGRRIRGGFALAGRGSERFLITSRGLAAAWCIHVARRACAGGATCEDGGEHTEQHLSAYLGTPWLREAGTVA